MLCSITRHKHELARLVEWPVTACMRGVMHVLLCNVGPEGIGWIQVPTILAHLPRSARRTKYDQRTVKIALSDWNKLGILDWERVPPFGRFPMRNAAGEVVRGRGEVTFHGGRVWLVNLGALRGETPPLSLLGTKLGRGDLQIPSGRDLQIPPSDPSDSSSSKKKDHAPSTGERRAAAAPPKDESETPSAPTAPPAPARPTAAHPARPAAAHVASETPTPSRATGAPPNGPGSAEERERAVGGRGSKLERRGPDGEGIARVDAMRAELEAALARPPGPRTR